jgi:hypothetical protein
VPAWVVVSAFATLASVFAPRPALALAVTFLALALATAFTSRVVPTFLGALGVLLLGYLVLGRGFAYLGVPPVFVGEVVFTMAVLTLLVSRRIGEVLTQPTSLLLVIFASFGALQTLPYLSTFGVDALRDAVISLRARLGVAGLIFRVSA